MSSFWGFMHRDLHGRIYGEIRAVVSPHPHPESGHDSGSAFLPECSVLGSRPEGT